MENPYDLIVIGSGPGGYVCAIKAAQLGLKVALIEKRSTFGGTCLNVGCIPSKALLYASEMFAQATHGPETLGVLVDRPKLNLEKMMAHKQATIKANVDGVAFLLKKNKITPYHGIGKIESAGKVSVCHDDGKIQHLNGRNIVIATGSDSAGIAGVSFEIDEKIIVSSTGALGLTKVPERLVVVGGGVIGLELGSVWKRLGSEVTVIEYMDKILGSTDRDISRHFLRLLQKQGLKFLLSSKVTGVAHSRSGVKVSHGPAQGEGTSEITADVVLVATGRKPYIDGLGLEVAGVEVERGMVKTNQHWQTSVPGIYAIGDVKDGPMLAHKAEDEGIAVAEILVGQKGHVNYNVIPSVVYTHPEVASVGKNEEELRAESVEYKMGKFPFTANARARAMNQTDGFVKILSDKITDRVLGVHILGTGASEMIHEAAVLMEFGGSSEDLARTCHGHPTLSEAVREAAFASFAKPIHM